MKKWILALLPLFLLTGCVTIPEDLQGSYPSSTPASMGAASNVGETVRWGGLLVATRPMDQQTCFEILSRPLDSQARPVRSRSREQGSVEQGESTGRFTACRLGFYDPQVYKSGKEITVIGILQGNISQQIGEMNIEEPLINATRIHLWHPRPQPIYYSDPFWGPGFGPYPWGDPWYGGYPGYYGGAVFIHRGGGYYGNGHHHPHPSGHR